MIAVILFSKLKITIIGCLVDNQFDGRIDFSLFNVKIISKRSGEKRKNQNGVFSLFKNRAGFYSSLKKYKMTLLEIKADVGLDDAAFTAISIGIIYSVMSWIYAVLNNYIEIETLNDLIKIKQCVDKEIILADVWNCDNEPPIKTTETIIEIYDDYRE